MKAIASKIELVGNSGSREFPEAASYRVTFDCNDGEWNEFTLVFVVLSNSGFDDALEKAKGELVRFANDLRIEAERARVGHDADPA
ncbi:hypothetical protein HDIA_2234 [Hartmannibacter diazotrophicus]|uniref:Uncharacterized protein n=1 Tax=Hartmannibacter diazotrophicus TaxID=1482074 RepID=A0A2C9D899_9HYPH|nr:hypothetical protein [Hartmannibacter diazotrophicus]SON55775.1 hypothetical protein HDIA_2234 [Hartmannibacter diazotrophicus]